MYTSIVGIDKAALLAALYNNARPVGLGVFQFTPTPMPIEQAAELLEKSNRFDYLGGRSLKVDFSDDSQFRIDLYDRDQGAGAAQRIIDSLALRFWRAVSPVFNGHRASLREP